MNQCILGVRKHLKHRLDLPEKFIDALLDERNEKFTIDTFRPMMKKAIPKKTYRVLEDGTVYDPETGEVIV